MGFGPLGSAVGITSFAGEAVNSGQTVAISSEFAAASAAATSVGAARLPQGNEETSAGSVVQVGADLAQAQAMIALGVEQLASHSAANSTQAATTAVLDEAAAVPTLAMATMLV